MAGFVKFCFHIAVVYSAIIFIKCQPDWNYDLISVEIENNTPDITFVNLSITRLGRGIFAMGGFVDLKEDVQESALWSGDIYYSSTGSGFIKTPFYLPETKFPAVMNTFYKDLLMESLLSCSDNAPLVDGEFRAPLTKRTIYLHDCFMSNENMPSKLKTGYYKVIFCYRNHAQGKVEMLVKVFND